MYGVAAIAADLMLRSRPPHQQFPRDPFISNYRAPHPEPTSKPADVSPLQLVAHHNSATRAIAAAALVGLIATFAMHLINLRMQNLGIAGSLISWSVALQAFAICVSAVAARPMIEHLGLRPTIPISSILCALALVTTFFAAMFTPFASCECSLP